MRSRSRTSWRAACRVRRAAGTTRRLRRRGGPTAEKPADAARRVRRASTKAGRRGERRRRRRPRRGVELADAMQWRCRHRTLDLTRPVVMGVLNVTPDSFSDGGRYVRPRCGARARPRRWWRRARRIIDVGGESTRPGAAAVEPSSGARAGGAGDRAHCGAARRRRFRSTPASPRSWRRRSAAGACIINDVRALRAPGAREAAARDRRAACA